MADGPSFPSFSRGIARCLSYPHAPSEALMNVVAEVLDMPDHANDRATLEHLRQRIADTPDAQGMIALVYGGATKIKGYVFEAPRLPEIRGGSALLDWVNADALPQLWRDRFEQDVGAEQGTQLAQDCCIYARGGNILAFAPMIYGQSLADQIEQSYTTHTLTANSAAVAAHFSLLELRYGRLPRDGTLFWVEEFTNAWNDPDLQPQLAAYYYGTDDELPRDRFLRRKTFGECATLLSTMFGRRRHERAMHDRHARVVPSYSLLPWAAKCDSSDVRPAVWQTRVGDEVAPRQMSQASALKRYAGLIVKRATADVRNWPREWLSKETEDELREDSWEQQWERYLAGDGKDSAYAAQAANLRVRPAKDVGEIGAASNGYIGMIYADGNNVGRLVTTLKTPGQYCAVSQLLAGAAKDAVFAAIAAHLEPIRIRSVKNHQEHDEYVHPFEILTIGGDDLLLIVPGTYALDIVLKIALAFEHSLAEKLPNIIPASPKTAQDRTSRYTGADTHGFTTYTPIIGLSAGVIIAQENAPIFFLRDLVDELLKNAKKLAKDRTHAAGDFGGAIDFMVMKSITMVTDNINAFRATALGDRRRTSDDPPNIPLHRLTARPYTWSEFAGLLATVRGLRDAQVPRSQLYRLRRVLQEAIDSGITASVMEYLYTRTRLRQGAALQQYIELPWHPALHNTGARIGLGPWLPRGNQRDWETIWGDLLEAYEMVP